MPIRRTLLFALLATTLSTPALAARDDIMGRWLTHKGGEIEIAPCRENPEHLCGFIASLADPERAPRDTENPDPALRDRPLLGLPLFFDFVYDDEDKWKEGHIYNVENGKTYDSKLRLLAKDKLKLSGCVLFFCKSYTWHRAPENDMPANRTPNP
jgi:uncharacterized protein (DUF2147 family)